MLLFRNKCRIFLKAQRDMSDPATPKLRDLAERLITHETAAEQLAPETGPVVFVVCSKLRRPLSTLAGVTGFSSLLARALVLAKDENPTLESVRVTDDGFLEFSGEIDQDKQLNGGGIVLVAQLIGLLALFIGEPLALRMLRETWPDVVGGHYFNTREN